MESNQNILEGVEAFKLMPGDVDHIFKMSGLQGNKLAIHKYDMEAAMSSSPSSGLHALMEHPLSGLIGQMLLEPEIKVAFKAGGNNAADNAYYAYARLADEGMLAQLEADNGEFLLLYFPNTAKFIGWWSDFAASEGMEGYPDIFGSFNEIESLILALHSADLYHRSYLESMLDYKGMMDLSFSTEVFMDLLKRSVASRDKRWFLASLFELTPGMRGNRLALKMEHLRALETMGFITLEGGKVTLGENAKFLGAEIVSSWMHSTGWSASVLHKGEEKNLSTVFFAVTSFANHLVSFTNIQGGEGRFNHKALNRNELEKTVAAWMQGIRMTASNMASQETDSVRPSERPLPKNEEENRERAGQKRFCGQCGAEARPGKKFCYNCGAPL